MHSVAIVGSRHRGWGKRAVDHTILIDSILQSRKEYYKDALNVSSLYCDRCFGKAVKDYCEEQGIKFFEFVVYFNGPREKHEYTAAYLGRHAALLEVCDEFHIAVSDTRSSTIEDLVQRVIASGKSYVLYNDNNEAIEFYDASAQEKGSYGQAQAQEETA